MCKFQKFGFCKFKERCKKKHLKETCENRSSCVNVKSCEKRHPYECKRSVSEGFCSFGSDCAYHHQAQVKTNNESEVNAKVDKLEKTLNEMHEKFLKLETKIKNIESKDNEAGRIKDTEKRAEDSKKTINKNENLKVLKEKKSKLKDHKDTVFRFGAEDRKNVTESKESKPEEKISTHFKCELCEYCKICRKEFRTSMEVVSHVAK